MTEDNSPDRDITDEVRDEITDDDIGGDTDERSEPLMTLDGDGSG